MCLLTADEGVGMTGLWRVREATLSAVRGVFTLGYLHSHGIPLERLVRLTLQHPGMPSVLLTV